VPLLVSLFTDSTDTTIKEMIRIFRENGEVVLCVGSSCRLQNSNIFRSSDLAVAVATLPGDKHQIPVDISDLINRCLFFFICLFLFFFFSFILLHRSYCFFLSCTYTFFGWSVFYMWRSVFMVNIV
jgi:hypothetical protein